MQNSNRITPGLSLLVAIMVCNFGTVRGQSAAPLARVPQNVTLVPMQAGTVHCSRLFDAVADELHWVAGSITAFTRALGVDSLGSQRLTADQVDELVTQFPEVFSYQPEPATDLPCLAIDVERLSSMLGDKKSKLRQWLARLQKRPLASLSKVTDTWPMETKQPPRIVVVMSGLHGIESTAKSMALQLHRETNLPTCTFSYPNDAPIFESAGLLVVRLQDLRLQYPNSKITLVAHSMGGLVSRAALEMEDIPAPIGVDQLIQICPPNHGSALAQYGPLLEGAEQVYRIFHRGRDGASRRLFSAIVDGFNEASQDLDPQSRFLSQLNGRPRNVSVRYCILAGNAGPLRGTLTSLISTVWDQIALSVDQPPELDRRIRDILTCDELQNGRGDGVVSLQSAKLVGVDDFRVLEMHHLVWNELDSAAGQKVIQEIVGRLGISL